jgi:hypothetical protein
MLTLSLRNIALGNTATNISAILEACPALRELDLGKLTISRRTDPNH